MASGSKITPNPGDGPCVCGAIHPCCRFLVDGGCPHRTPGDHHHSSDRMARATLAAVGSMSGGVAGRAFADAVVPADLVIRAEALALRGSRAVSDCWEMGRHPKVEPMNVEAFAELSVLVRDLAKVVAQR